MANGVADHFANNDDVVILFANSGNNAGTIEQFLTRARTDIPSLMDQSEELYRSYVVPEYFAPYPRQIVVDQTGVIRYLSGQYDAPAVVRAIESLLE